MKKLDIAVLMGGVSAEREVSLVSGTKAADALESLGHTVRRIDVTRDLKQLIDDLTPAPDVCFNALHGTCGEDGVIQGILDWQELKYTHSGRLASAIAMSKPLTNQLAEAAGLDVAAHKLVLADDLLQGDLPLDFPFVVKPPAEGSSVGVHIILTEADLPALEVLSPDEIVMVEQFIPGRELTVAVKAGQALGVTEIVSDREFFDYTAKYTDGQASHYCPAQMPLDLEQKAMRQAEVMHDRLECKGLTRCDFRYDPKTERLVFLEINTQPGLTPISLAPEQADKLAGIDYPALCQWMVEEALA
ncbi:MAG: D-alanine--D-alanine ligase [Alphaproteobacteria bacterium]